MCNFPTTETTTRVPLPPPSSVAMTLRPGKQNKKDENIVWVAREEGAVVFGQRRDLIQVA